MKLGYIVYVTDKHRGDQEEIEYDDLKDYPVLLFHGSIPKSILAQARPMPVQATPVKRDSEIGQQIIRLEPSDEAVKEEIAHLKEIIHNQQKHIQRLERRLYEERNSDAGKTEEGENSAGS